MKKILTLLILSYLTPGVFAQMPQMMLNTDGITKAEKVGTDLFYFRVQDSSGSWIQELWKISASVNSAVKITSLGVLSSPVGEAYFIKAINNKLFFTTKLAPNDDQLWVSDGTASGTLPLLKLSAFVAIGEFNNKLCISGLNYSNTAEHLLYTSDGTPAGTQLLKAYSPVTEGISNFVTFNGKLVFTVKKGLPNNPASESLHLISSDGTPAGTVMIDSLYGDARRYAGGNGVNTPSQYLREYNGHLYFVLINRANGNTDELWRTNGTAGNAAYFNTAAHPLMVYNNKLILAGGNSTTGTELFSTDGTVNGTTLIKDINTSGPGFLASKPSNLNIACGKLFFLAVDSSFSSSRIWTSDGTTAGTVVHTPQRGTYFPITQHANGTLYYAFSPDDMDSMRVFKVDTLTCLSEQVMSWAHGALGLVGQIIPLNQPMVIVGGGTAGQAGLYTSGLPTGIAEQAARVKPTTLFPNPAQEWVQWDAKADLVILYDLMGKEVLRDTTPSTQLNVTQQPAGVYWIRFQQNDQWQTHKLIIQH